MGIKTFTSTVLSSSDVNTYLMNQTIIVCTSGTRPGSPVTGMHIYETDTDIIRYWTGAAWAVEIAPEQSIFFSPGGNLDTPGAGTATWATLGSITVPTGVTKAYCDVSILGCYDNGTTASVTVKVKIGTGAGNAPRLMVPGVAAQRFNQTLTDVIAAPPSGAQNVTLEAVFGSGSTVRLDTTSKVMARIRYGR